MLVANSKGPMKVFFLKPAITKEIGGVRRFSQNLAEAMDPLCEMVFDSVFASDHSSVDNGKQLRRSLRLLKQTMDLRSREKNLRTRNLIDVAFHSFHWPPKLSKVPTVGFVHDLRQYVIAAQALPRRTNLEAKAVRRAISSWDVCAVPSPHVADDVDHFASGAKIWISGEGIDHFSRVSLRPQTNKVIIISGRAPHKRPELAVEIANDLASIADVEVTLLGPVAGEPIGPNIRQIEGVTDEELAREISSSSIALFTTSYEGFGLAAGEVLWQGRGIVYAAGSGLGDLVGSAGVEVKSTRSDFVAGAIHALSISTELGLKALEIGSNRTWSQVASGFLRVFQSLT